MDEEKGRSSEDEEDCFLEANEFDNERPINAYNFIYKICKVIYNYFTGFKQPRPEAILAATYRNGGLYLITKFEMSNQLDLIAYNIAIRQFPELVIRFYENSLSDNY